MGWRKEPPSAQLRCPQPLGRPSTSPCGAVPGHTACSHASFVTVGAEPAAPRGRSGRTHSRAVHALPSPSARQAHFRACVPRPCGGRRSGWLCLCQKFSRARLTWVSVRRAALTAAWALRSFAVFAFVHDFRWETQK